MAQTYGPPSIITNGLVFVVDPGNPESWSSPSSTDVYDIVERGIDPIITGSTINDNSPGPLDGSVGYFDFDGTDDYIKFPAANVILPDSPYNYITVECWANPDSIDNYAGIWSLGHPTGGIGIGLWTRSVNWIQFGVYPGSDQRTSVTNYSVDYPGWRLITCTYNGVSGGGKIFIDGIERANNTNTGTFSTNDSYDMRIASDNGTGVELNGKIGPLKIYNRVLTDSEIMQNYEATKNRYQ